MKQKILVYAVFLLFFSFCKKENPDHLQIELQDWNGHKTSLADYSGKYVILDVWATWCGPCRDAVPVMERIKKEIPEGDFMVLGINADTDATIAEIKKTAKELGMSYPSLLDNKLLLSTALQVEGIPKFYILDPAGEIIYQQSGLVYRDYPQIMAFLYKLNPVKKPFKN